jgi:hypothetical protein
LATIFSSFARPNVMTASDAKIASAVDGRIVNDPPPAVWSRAPIQSASSGPPIHTFMPTTAISAASMSRLARDARAGAACAGPVCAGIPWPAVSIARIQ